MRELGLSTGDTDQGMLGADEPAEAAQAFPSISPTSPPMGGMLGGAEQPWQLASNAGDSDSGMDMD